MSESINNNLTEVQLKPSEALQTDFDIGQLLDHAERQQVLPQSASGAARTAHGVIVGQVGFLLPDGYHEVIDNPTICPLPFSPQWLLGMVNVRGDTVPVIDLRAQLEIEHQGGDESKGTKPLHLVLDIQPSQIALRVDSIAPRTTYHPHERLDSPPLSARLRTYTHGVYLQQDTLWIDADLPALLLAVAKQA